MTTPEFFATPGFGERQLEVLHYNQAVRIGDRVEISGQGGWDDELTFPDDLRDEIAQAFDNVERTLSLTGATWRDVVAVDSYHVPDSTEPLLEAHSPAVVEQFRLRMGDRAPIWTQIGVAALGHPKMRVEVRVTAVVGHSA